MKNLIVVLLKPRAWVAKLLILFMALGFAALHHYGYLKPLTDFLGSEALTVKLGDYNLSALFVCKVIFSAILVFWLTGIISEFGEQKIKKIKRMKASNRALLTKIYSIVDVLLGGRRGTAAMRIEGRPYTTIERSLVERMVEVVLNDMSIAFEPLSPVTFKLDRMETNPRFAAIARPANAAILVRLRIDMEDRGGRIELALPYATLEPIRELLLQMFMGEKFGRDSIWESHLATELWNTQIPIEAVLDEQAMSLRDVMNFEVGQTVMLNCTADSVVKMRCGNIGLVDGKMGRIGTKIAVRINSRMTGIADGLPV